MAEDKTLPPQHQEHHPGSTEPMHPKPEEDDPRYKGSGKLAGKRALITGGDSGIGRAVAMLYAKEGADVSILYYDQDEDALEAKRLVEERGGKCMLVKGDVSDPGVCRQAVDRTVSELGGLDILVNNASQQYVQYKVEDLPDEQIEKTFRVNILGMIYMAREAVRHMGEGAVIIQTTSITAYEGNPRLVDYSATKGAILSLTRALAVQLAPRGIRVNAVAPGPIWTPLIPSSFPAEEVETFGKSTLMGRPGQPREVAPAYVFLASEVDSSYITGLTIHVNGGRFHTT